MNDLKLIKKYYGENMMHLCRELFPTILETEGLLFNILKDKFAYSKFLYNDLKSQNLVFKFKDYIYSLVDVEKEELDVTKTPIELLDEAGYILYECKSEEDIQRFKKYYAKNEELCTFKDERLKSCYVFFAVKKNVDKIKREDFIEPMRQDEYGTSVISIQFSRGEKNTLSIKNRYNHRVKNPDATFSNNLDNIITGLTDSFEKTYNFNINQSDNKEFELDGYVLANDGKYYKYNCEVNNTYFCPNNIIIKDFEVNNEYLEKEKYLIIDYFILDLVNKEIKQIDSYYKDSFLDELVDIKKILILRNNSTKKIKITYQENKECFIEIDNQNRILSYKNEFIEEIKGEFLAMNKCLEKIFLPNVKKICNKFLFNNNSIEEINLPKVKDISHFFLFRNNCIKKINLPNLEKIGDEFLFVNNSIEEINLPKVKEIGMCFMYYNKYLKNISLPNVEQISHDFLKNNESIEEVNLPKVKKIGGDFLSCNRQIKSIFFPCVEEIGEDSLCSSINNIEYIYVPNLNEESIELLKVHKDNGISRK